MQPAEWEKNIAHNIHSDTLERYKNARPKIYLTALKTLKTTLYTATHMHAIYSAKTKVETLGQNPVDFIG